MQKQKNNATKETRIKSSFWGDAWRRLKQDRAAVVALCARAADSLRHLRPLYRARSL